MTPRCPGRACPGRARGFTLIEVAVVLLILTLAAGLVLPSIVGATDAVRARLEIASVMAFLRYAREQAITRRETYEVGLGPDARTLLLTTGKRREVKAARQIRPPARIAVQSPGPRTVIFFPEGRATGGAFLVEASGRRLYQITVDPLSGRVSNRRVQS
jgi:general secretion pathway protein H